jgi:hypothetical protein
MDKVFRIAVAASAVGMTALSLSAPAQAGNGSAVRAGLVGFGIGAILGSMMGPPDVYFVPPPPDYYGPVVYGPPEYYRPGPYGPPPRTPNWYGNRAYPRPNTPPPAAAHAYPRSKTPPPAAAQARRPAPTRSATATATAAPAAVPPKPNAQAKFMAAQAKAKRDGVETLTQKDIEGLTPEQIKQLRGY